MKNKFVILFVLAALLISLIPVSVFAGAPAELKVFVRNTTGAEVDLRLTDADGNFHWATLPAGVTELALTEGQYEYYAVTFCGSQVGQWNLNVSKQLDIHCKDGMLEFNLAKRCDNNWWGTLYHVRSNINIKDVSITKSMPTSMTVFIEHDSVNVHDWLLSDGMPSSSTVIRGETVCWSDAINMYPWRVKEDLGVWFLYPFEPPF